MANTPIRHVRIGDDTWHDLLRTSLGMGVSVSEVIRLAIQGMLKDAS